jgi:hypothetical protein
VFFRARGFEAKQIAHAPFQLKAVIENHIGRPNCLYVVRVWTIQMRIDPIAHQLLNLHLVASNLTDHVSYHSRRGDNNQFAGIGWGFRG